MTTGVIKVEDLDNIQNKTTFSSRYSSPHLSQTDRSSSGISSISNSSVISKFPALTSPIVELSCNSSESNVTKEPINYSNFVPHRNSCDLVNPPYTSRTICTGVLTLQDELCIDLQKKTLTNVALSKEKSMVQTCVDYLQSKWRSLPVMLPVKSGVDKKPLSPKSQQDENTNQRHGDDISSGSILSISNLVSNQPVSTGIPSTFSCIPVYITILIIIFLILVVGSVTTVIDVKPEFLYGSKSNNSHNDSILNENMT